MQKVGGKPHFVFLWLVIQNVVMTVSNSSQMLTLYCGTEKWTIGNGHQRESRQYLARNCQFPCSWLVWGTISSEHWTSFILVSLDFQAKYAQFVYKMTSLMASEVGWSMTTKNIRVSKCGMHFGGNKGVTYEKGSSFFLEPKEKCVYRVRSRCEGNPKLDWEQWCI